MHPLERLLDLSRPSGPRRAKTWLWNFPQQSSGKVGFALMERIYLKKVTNHNKKIHLGCILQPSFFERSLFLIPKGIKFSCPHWHPHMLPIHSSTSLGQWRHNLGFSRTMVWMMGRVNILMLRLLIWSNGTDSLSQYYTIIRYLTGKPNESTW